MHPTRIFQSPEDLQKAWDEFKTDVKYQANEWLKVQYVGKNGDRVEDSVKVPLTMEGFRRFCYLHYGEIEQYFRNKDEYYNDFVDICSRIKNEIRENQIIGGMLGFFNTSITQRLNGLTEKVDNTVNITPPLFPDTNE